MRNCYLPFKAAKLSLSGMYLKVLYFFISIFFCLSFSFALWLFSQYNVLKQLAERQSKFKSRQCLTFETLMGDSVSSNRIFVPFLYILSNHWLFFFLEILMIFSMSLHYWV